MINQKAVLQKFLTLYLPTPKNCQPHSKNILAVVNKLFQCTWPFCGAGDSRVNGCQGIFGGFLQITNFKYSGNDFPKMWKDNMQCKKIQYNYNTHKKLTI